MRWSGSRAPRTTAFGLNGLVLELPGLFEKGDRQAGYRLPSAANLALASSIFRP